MIKELISLWTEKKESFLRAVSWALLNIDVDHQMNSDGDTLQSISVTKTI
jgi:hypothetical protein